MMNLVSFGGQVSWEHIARPFLKLARRSSKRSMLATRTLDVPSSQDTVQESDTHAEIRLNNLVGEAVFQGLSHFGGSDVVESLIYILELEHSVNLKNIVKEIEEFRRGLTKMFGDAAYVVEGRVCANLAKTLGLDPEGRTLEELIEAARISLAKDSNQDTDSV